ncbi:hypothetical protein M0R72_14825 [Candidatus Pacearchaeota archaeon]|jgi:hypothetical protein|nr:hypothetical protein [Candidatus Pacearchaeota archaeon]
MKMEIKPFDKVVEVVPFRPGMPVFIRYGLWDNRSYNHRTGEKEFGVSVYCGRVVAESVELADDTSVQLVGQGRLVFPLTGDVIGFGSDGEPIIRRIRVVGAVGMSLGCRIL